MIAAGQSMACAWRVCTGFRARHWRPPSVRSRLPAWASPTSIGCSKPSPNVMYKPATQPADPTCDSPQNKACRWTSSLSKALSKPSNWQGPTCPCPSPVPFPACSGSHCTCPTLSKAWTSSTAYAPMNWAPPCCPANCKAAPAWSCSRARLHHAGTWTAASTTGAAS
ncbi:hypothetical protein D3C71_1552180 [compost metagenome]